jgi:hypothetical protein
MKLRGKFTNFEIFPVVYPKEFFSVPVAGVRFQTTYLLLIFKGEGEGGSEGWWPRAFFTKGVRKHHI